MTNKLTDEQETVRSVFGAYINDLKAYSSKPDRPMFRRLEEVRDKAIQALEEQRWIPISEKLPENDTDVLICYITKGKKWATIGFQTDGDWYGQSDEGFGYMNNIVTIDSWRPIPEFGGMDE